MPLDWRKPHDHETYTDGISEITVTGSIVRVDLMSLSPSERDIHGNPVPVLRQRLILPADAFANAADLMQQVKNSLIESGVIQPGKPPQEAVPFAGAARAATPRRTSPDPSKNSRAPPWIPDCTASSPSRATTASTSMSNASPTPTRWGTRRSRARA